MMIIPSVVRMMKTYYMKNFKKPENREKKKQYKEKKKRAIYIEEKCGGTFDFILSLKEGSFHNFFS